jgi:chromosome segregation ATPase
MPPEKKSSDLHAVFKHLHGEHATETEMADRPPCFKCVELEKKVQDLQRIINRGAHQHADGMDLMCEMQRVNNETVQAHQKRISTLEAQLHEWESSNLHQIKESLRQRESDCHELSSAYDDMERENNAAAEQAVQAKIDKQSAEEAAAKSNHEKQVLLHRLMKVSTDLKREHHARLLLSHDRPEEEAAVTGLLSIISGMETSCLEMARERVELWETNIALKQEKNAMKHEIRRLKNMAYDIANHSIRAGEEVGLGAECHESHDSEPPYPLALQRIAATCVAVDGESFHRGTSPLSQPGWSRSI